METAWSTMWNVTDETPVNCERFLAGGGMYLFLKVIKSLSSSSSSTCVLPILPLTCKQLAPQCKERFPEKADLLRNMMGLLGNVAEVLIISIITIITNYRHRHHPFHHHQQAYHHQRDHQQQQDIPLLQVPELRHKLMTREFVEEFAFLLDSYSDGIEVLFVFTWNWSEKRDNAQVHFAGVLQRSRCSRPHGKWRARGLDCSSTWEVRIPSKNHEMADKDHNRKDGGENIIVRSFVLDRMVRAINRWDISSSRNINYRSFAPIIRWHRSWNYQNSVTQGYNLHYHIRHSIITHPEEHQVSLIIFLWQAGGGAAYSRMPTLGGVGTCKSYHGLSDLQFIWIDISIPFLITSTSNSWSFISWHGFCPIWTLTNHMDDRCIFTLSITFSATFTFSATLTFTFLSSSLSLSRPPG